MTSFENNIPQAMRRLNNWICWKIENKGGKPTKIPINPKTGGNAQSNNPGTWSDFQTALNACKRYKHSGIGFMFTLEAGIVGVDVDKCRNKESEKLTDQAGDILSTLNTYSELSPSGTGVHVIARGKLPAGGRRSGNVEMYSEGRFFTITGKILDGYSANLEERSRELEIVHRKYISKPQEPRILPASVSDDINSLIEKAIQSKTGYKFKALYEGNWQGLYSSQSEADQAFCNMLAFWMGADPIKMDTSFRQSGLYRKKWDEKHGQDTYGNMTINNSVRNCRDVYIPNGEYRSKQAQDEPKELKLISLDSVRTEPVSWLWYPYIPKGKLTLLQGNPGEGKTFFALNLSAIVSKGDPMPGEKDDEEPGIVLYQSAEDSLSDTIKPRLEQAGADCSKIFCIDEAQASLTFRDDRIDKMMAQLKPALVVFDPIQGFLGAETDMHRANEVRPVMARLLKLAEQYNCAILLLMHLSKSQSSNKLYRGLGSIDIVAAARSVLLCGCDPNNENNRGIVHIKSSLAPVGEPIGFTLDKDNGFRWKGKSDLTADMMLNPQKQEPDKKITSAKELLLEMLEGGTLVLTDAIKEKGEELGISMKTFYRAKEELGIKAKKVGFKNAKWYWFLEDCQDERPYIDKDTNKMSTFGKNVDITGSYEDRQCPPSTIEDRQIKTCPPSGQTLGITELNRRKTNILLTYPQSGNDEEAFEEAMKGVNI